MSSRNGDLKTICRRYRALYTGVVADTREEMGMRDQALPYDIRPLSTEMKGAGFAFTLQGRAVGAANGRNPLPIVLPCHRVIGADGSLTGFGGGLPTKHFLLTLENALPTHDLFDQ